MDLTYLHPIWAIAVYGAAIGGAHLQLRDGARLEPSGRYVSIDGLRGLLATGVFICHIAVWYQYPLTGIWRNSPSPFYLHLGETSVVLFFMVTGFLFWGKILDTRDKTMDWRALYRSRFFRIVPLYLLALLFLATAVTLASGFILHVPSLVLAWEWLSWISFTLTGWSGINGFRETIPLLGVAWTLIYEWLFYFSLPLLACLVGVRARMRWLLAAVLAVGFILISIWRLDAEVLPSFAWGMAAAHLARTPGVADHLKAPWAAVLVIQSLTLEVSLFPSTAYHPGAEAILFVGFSVIACGNTLGGLLVMPAVRLLGQISYSIYLLHLFSLYLLFGLFLRNGNLLPIPPWQHWILALLLTPLLVRFCYFTWHQIEAPNIARGHSLRNL
ncbi:MAG TPA: acyltransferase [Methylococcaceae bacterium]|nr:acyltransferase [Methylococcaceae bacterium]